VWLASLAQGAWKEEIGRMEGREGRSDVHEKVRRERRERG
jgi:hypothetical protein